MPPRPRSDSRLKVSVTADERALIEAKAEALGLSVSAYLRNIGLGHQPKTVADHEAVTTLSRLHGDLGRLGGLLKLWLTDRPGDGAPVQEVRGVLREIEQLHWEVKDAVKKL